MTREIIGDPIIFADGSRPPISQAVRANGFLFVAGQLGVDANFALTADDIAGQTAQALENLKARLAEGGSAPEHVVKVTAWITDPADFKEFNRVYATVFGDAPPARSTVVSGLLIPGAKVEIEAIAVVP